MPKKTIAALAIAALLMAGCAWVKLTPSGENVRVLAAHEISACDEMGKTSVSLADKVAGLKRDPEKVKGELEILARNSAVNIGGDTVVPISEISGGQQNFAVYKCVEVAR